MLRSTAWTQSPTSSQLSYPLVLFYEWHMTCYLSLEFIHVNFVLRVPGKSLLCLQLYTRNPISIPELLPLYFLPKLIGKELFIDWWSFHILHKDSLYIYLCGVLVCEEGCMWFLGHVLVYEERYHTLVYMEEYGLGSALSGSSHWSWSWVQVGWMLECAVALHHSLSSHSLLFANFWAQRVTTCHTCLSSSLTYTMVDLKLPLLITFQGSRYSMDWYEHWIWYSHRLFSG